MMTDIHAQMKRLRIGQVVRFQGDTWDMLLVRSRGAMVHQIKANPRKNCVREPDERTELITAMVPDEGARITIYTLDRSRTLPAMLELYPDMTWEQCVEFLEYGR